MLAARTKRRRSAVDYARLARGDDDEVYPEENEPEERLEGPEEAAQGAPAVGRRSLIARRPKKGAVGRRSRSARLVMSDDSDDLLGVDEDASEDFVPGAVDSREEEDADAEEEEDEGPDAGDREDEDEGVDAGAREKEQESLKVVLRSRGSALESSSPRASRVVSAVSVPGIRPAQLQDPAMCLSCVRPRPVAMAGKWLSFVPGASVQGVKGGTHLVSGTCLSMLGMGSRRGQLLLEDRVLTSTPLSFSRLPCQALKCSLSQGEGSNPMSLLLASLAGTEAQPEPG